MGSCLLQKRPTLSERVSFTDGGGISAWRRSFCSLTTTLENVAKLILQCLPQKRHLSPLVHTCHIVQMTTLAVRLGQIGDFQSNCKFGETFRGFCIHVVLSIWTSSLTFRFGKCCKRPPSFHPDAT